METPVVPHLLLLPFPCQGHMNPILQFGKRLAFKGMRVTLLTTRHCLKAVDFQLQGLEIESISDGFDDGGIAAASSLWAYLERFKAEGFRTLVELIQKLATSDYPISCLVYDPFLYWALEVAHQARIAGAAFFTNSAAFCSFFCLASRGLVSLPDGPGAEPVRLPGLPPPLGFSEIQGFFAPEIYPTHFEMVFNQFSNLEKAGWIFGNTFHELEAEVAEAALEIFPVKMVGPLIPSAYLDGRIKDDTSYGAHLWKPDRYEEYCLNWLSTKPSSSVVYVAFGTVAKVAAKQMEEIAWGLNACEMHFLWVVNESEQGLLPDGYLNSMGDKGFIASWCGQLEVLAHPAIGCFVSHCGWNSTLEALSQGVPMVGMPRDADQHLNAKLVEEVWGVGVRASVDEEGIVRREEIQSCIREVMEGARGEGIQKNSYKWKSLAKEAMDEGGSSNKVMEDFVREVVTIASGTRVGERIKEKESKK